MKIKSYNRFDTKYYFKTSGIFILKIIFLKGIVDQELEHIFYKIYAFRVFQYQEKEKICRYFVCTWTD